MTVQGDEKMEETPKGSSKEKEPKKKTRGRDIKLPEEMHKHISGLLQGINNLLDRHTYFYGDVLRGQAPLMGNPAPKMPPVYTEFFRDWRLCRRFLATLEMSFQEVYEEGLEIHALYTKPKD